MADPACLYDGHALVPRSATPVQAAAARLIARGTIARGVSGCDRQALNDDCRLSALWLIARPVAKAANNIGPAVWWNNLERIMLAVDDLECRELLA
jgi:hypothetical protein